MAQTLLGRAARRRNLLVALLMALALTAVFAAPASAGPAGPIVSLSDLQTKLASGPLDGYMLTTMQGTTPEQIPVRVLAVVEASTWGKLIMFDSTDPAIVQSGGIAAGMSGSPIYVSDHGTDKLIGAVSYGEDFSLGGTGLATPIEYMSQEQDKYGTAAGAPAGAAVSKLKNVTLASPVRTSSGEVRSLVLAATTQAAAGVTASSGQIVMHPLALAEIGGLPVASNAYRKLAAKLESAGLTVRPAATSAAASMATTPDLEPGSPCGVLFSNGFYWLGVLGTVTYVDGDTVMTFGHPILGDEWSWDLGAGPLQGTLTGATVDGIWPSSASPSKMMTPADAKGTAIEDRSAGVIAKLGDSSAESSEFPVTTSVTIDGAASPVVDTTNVDQWFATTYWPGLVFGYGMEDPGAVGTVVSAGLYHALDCDATTGSGTTTTTVVAHEPGSAPVTITHDNVYDTDGSEWSLGDFAGGDAANIVSSLANDPYGVRHVIVDSVNVTASLSSSRRNAGLVDLQLARALESGDNDVVVQYYEHGSAELQTQHVTLTIPKGTSLSGMLGVYSASGAADYGYSYYMGYSEPAPAPQTLAQVAAQLEASGQNGDLEVTYAPNDESDSGPTAAAQTTVHTGWVFSGYIAKQTASVSLHAPAKVSFGSPVVVTGMVMGATADVPVAIYCRPAGAAEPATPERTVTATYADGVATFSALLPPSLHTETVSAEVGALSSNGLPGAASRTVAVMAKVTLNETRAGNTVRLTARVRPKDAGGKVQFQRLAAGHWVTFKQVAVGSDGSAHATLAGKTKPAIRARFAGSATNAASAWVSATAAH